jgi:hypothetical protein
LYKKPVCDIIQSRYYVLAKSVFNLILYDC